MKVQLTDNGTTWGFRPLDDEARDKLHNIGAEPWQFLGSTLCVDHRPAQQLVEVLSDEGVEFVQ